MTKLRSALMVFALGLVAATSHGANQVPVKQHALEDFFRKPQQAAYSLADNGQALAFLRPVGSNGQAPRMNIFVQMLKDAAPVGAERQLTNESARDIAGFFWKGSDIILYSKDFGGDENFHVLSINVKNNKIIDLTPQPGARAEVLDSLHDDPDHVLISSNQRDPKIYDVYRINVRTGATELVAKNPGNIVSWTTDHAGRVRVALASDQLKTVFLYRQDEKSDFVPLFSTDYRVSVDPQFFTPDNKKIYALSNRGRDKAALVIIDPAQPQTEQLIFSSPEVDIGGASYSRKRRQLTLASYTTDKRQLHFFDKESQRIHEKIASHLPGYEISIFDADDDENIFLVATYNDRTPGGRYIYDLQHDALTKLSEVNPWLPEADMAPVQPISYQSRDGLTIHGYLTLPVGRAPKNLACIINPHGGPWARDGWGYNPELQFFANRGFCILQMNFRGSTGYGRKFWEAGFGQWGLKMQDDITDGVEWLVKQGIADPKRIGIYGASYGGYATLAGIVFTPDLYAAAVDYVGVSNLFTLLKTIPPYWTLELKQMYEQIGDPVRDKERLLATSPVFHAKRIKAPLFIAQGARDPRVNKDESDQMVKALQARGIQVQYMVKDNEGHGFANQENQFDFYRAAEKFLVEHLKP